MIDVGMGDNNIFQQLFTVFNAQSSTSDFRTYSGDSEKEGFSCWTEEWIHNNLHDHLGLTYC